MGTGKGKYRTGRNSSSSVVAKSKVRREKKRSLPQLIADTTVAAPPWYKAACRALVSDGLERWFLKVSLPDSIPIWRGRLA